MTNNIGLPEDICAHLGDEYDRYMGAIVPPLFQNTLFTRKTMDHGYRYSRIANPTTDILEEKLAALEHAEACTYVCFGYGRHFGNAGFFAAGRRSCHCFKMLL